MVKINYLSVILLILVVIILYKHIKLRREAELFHKFDQSHSSILKVKTFGLTKI